jgi:hypothetical protein
MNNQSKTDILSIIRLNLTGFSIYYGGAAAVELVETFFPIFVNKFIIVIHWGWHFHFLSKKKESKNFPFVKERKVRRK